MSLQVEHARLAAINRLAIERDVRDRVLTLAPGDRRKLPRALASWPTLDFKGFLAAVRKAWGVKVPLKAQGEWQAYLAANGAEHRTLTARIAAAERDIDTAVYALFDLTPEEITLLEGASG